LELALDLRVDLPGFGEGLLGLPELFAAGVELRVEAID
jgi:hypothetical protein